MSAVPVQVNVKMVVNVVVRLVVIVNMKTRYKILIIVGIIIIGFIIWSLVDTTCKPCSGIPGPDGNIICVSMCIPEPRWYDWFRY